MPAAPVLDSHALARIPAWRARRGTVAALLEKAGVRDVPLHMTEVNYAEMKYSVLRKAGPIRWEEIARDLPTVPIEFHPADRRLSDSAADFKARFKISLADAFAAALAKERKAELVTGDLEFKALEKVIKVAWLKAGKPTESVPMNNDDKRQLCLALMRADNLRPFTVIGGMRLRLNSGAAY